MIEISLFQVAMYTLALFALGSVFGSFLNVVIYRTAMSKSWLFGRSKCDSCGRQVRWYDNIPIVSYLWLRGKCRDCLSPIGITHFVIEILAGSLFVWWYWFGFLFFQLTQNPFQYVQPLFWLMVGLILLAIFISDYQYYIIPDLFSASLLVITLMYRIALVISGQMQFIDFAWALVAATAAMLFFFFLWFFTKGKGMGFGDVKLVFSLVLLVGASLTPVLLFVSFLSGAFVGVSLIVMREKKFGQVVPFGPFLIFATVLTLLVGNALLDWYWSLLML